MTTPGSLTTTVVEGAPVRASAYLEYYNYRHLRMIRYGTQFSDHEVAQQLRIFAFLHHPILIQVILLPVYAEKDLIIDEELVGGLP